MRFHRSLLAVACAASLTACGGLDPQTQGAEQAARDGFTDIRGHWAEPFIRALAARDVALGYPGTAFHPDDVATRAELAALVARAFSLTATGGSTFTDVADDHWASRSIEAAVDAGFLVGYPDGTFVPDAPVRRIEVLVALTRGLELVAPCAVGSCESLLFDFDDDTEIPAWGVRAMATALRHGLIVSEDVRTLAPLEEASRGELAAMVYQAMLAQADVPFVSSSRLVPVTAGDEVITVSTAATQAVLSPNGRHDARLDVNERAETNTLYLAGTDGEREVRPGYRRRFFGFGWVDSSTLLVIDGPKYQKDVEGGQLLLVDAETGSKELFLEADDLAGLLYDQGAFEWAGFHPLDMEKLEISRFRVEARDGVQTLVLDLHLRSYEGKSVYPRLEQQLPGSGLAYLFRGERWK